MDSNDEKTDAPNSLANVPSCCGPNASAAVAMRAGGVLAGKR
jgi:hypothetical protein